MPDINKYASKYIYDDTLDRSYFNGLLCLQLIQVQKIDFVDCLLIGTAQTIDFGDCLLIGIVQTTMDFGDHQILLIGIV